MSKEYSKFIKKADFAINSGISFDQQGEYIEKLFVLERDIQNEILKLKNADKMYQAFVSHITEKMRNILRARTFFRVKEKDFNKNLSPAFKNKDFKEIQKYPITYPLVMFFIPMIPKRNTKITKMFQEYSEVRNAIIRSMMGLAIRKANSFYDANRNYNSSKLDFINIAMVGLCAGVDKYTPENGKFSNVFRSVCLAYITRFLIESNGQSVAKLPSGDKKMLYKINILRFRQGVTNIDDITGHLNEFYQSQKLKGAVTPKLPITSEKVRGIIEAISIESEDTTKSVVLKDDSCYYSMEEDFEKAEIYREVSKAIKKLSIREIKVIKLKGVDL